MGWDAYATKRKGNKRRFREVSDKVVAQCGSVDWGLSRGMLDCSDCGVALEALTGFDAWDERWSPSKVREGAERAALWMPEDIEQDKCWAYWSAKQFLDVCSDIGSGVKFTN